MPVRYIKNKRERIGRCNICQRDEALTWDHVPPKGGIELSEVEQQNIFQYMTGKHEGKKYVLSQNGVKYRTICSTCNNDLLGARLDPVLNAFTIGVSSLLNTKCELPSRVSWRTKPNLLVRAILGHLLSAKGDFADSKTDQEFREYVLDFNIPIPNGIKVFYWVYPYSRITILRDVAMLAKLGHFAGGSIGVFSILKYFPMAFLVSNLEEYEGLDDLTRYCSNCIEEEVDILVNLQNVKDENWPEIHEGNFIMAGKTLDSGISAIPRHR